MMFSCFKFTGVREHVTSSYFETVVTADCVVLSDLMDILDASISPSYPTRRRHIQCK